MFDKICQLIATMIILRSLQLNFANRFEFCFSPKLAIIKFPGTYSNQLQKIEKYCSAMEKECPSVYTRLELGLSWEDSIDKNAGHM